MIFTLLTLAGAVAISATALRLLRRRASAAGVIRGTLVLTAVVGGAVLALRIAPPARVRAILIVDDAAGRAAGVLDLAERKKAAATASAALEKLRTDGLSEYDLIAITGESRTESQLPNWRPADQPPDLTTAEVALDPEAALGLAAARFELPAWQRLLRADPFHPNRVVVAATFPKDWGRYEFKDVGGLISRFREARVTVDLWENSDGNAPAAIDIIPSAAILPANRSLKDFANGLSVRFRVTSPRLSEQPIGQLVRWHFRGTIRGKSPEGLGAPNLVPDGFDSEAVVQGNPGQKEYAGDERVLTDRSVQITCRLNQIQPAGAVLVEGLNLIAAKLTVTTGGVVATAERALYFPAEFRTVMVVSGSDSTGLGPAVGAVRLQKAWDALGLAGSGRLPWHLYVKQVTESDFLDLLGQKDNARPFLLVLHRPSSKALIATWQNGWVKSGTHLLLSGFPPLSTDDLATALGLLPVVPRLSPYDGDGKKPTVANEKRVPWVLNRQPRLLFIRDPSRLWSATSGPSPEPIVAVGGSPLLAAGTTLQDRIIEQVRERLGVKIGSPLEGPNGWVDVIDFDPRKSKLFDPAQTNDRSSLWEWSDLSYRLQVSPALPKVDAPIGGRSDTIEEQAPPPFELRTNDVLVVFTANAPQQTKHPPAVARAVARGAVVRLVVLETPFDEGLKGLPPGTVKTRSVDKLRKELPKESADIATSERLPFSEADVMARAAVTSADFAALRVWVDTRAGRPTPLARADEVAAKIAEGVRTRLLVPTSSHFQVHRLGRVLDERFGPAVDESSPPPVISPADAWMAPIRQQVIDARKPEWQAPLYASITESGDRNPGGQPVAALRAGIVDAGTVAVVGYSPFEDTASRVSGLATASGQTTVPIRWRVYSPSDFGVDRWGPQRVLDLADFHGRLTESVGEQPQIVAAERMGANSRVRVTVSLRKDATPVAILREESPPPGTTAAEINGRLLDVRDGRQTVMYEFDSPPVERAGWWRLAGGRTVDRLYLTGQRAADTNLPAVAAVAAVAGFTGGAASPRIEQLPPPALQVRVWGLVLAVASLAFLWALQLAVRVAAAIRSGRKAAAESKRALSEPVASGTVAGAGGALAPPVTHLIAGPFAGFRPFEPGDRLSSAVHEDLVLLAGLRLPIIPRLVRRTDEQSTAVVLAIAVGRSARIPAPLVAGIPPKLVGLAVAAELLAEMVWQQNGQVTVRLVGSANEARMGPFRAEPSPGALRKFVLAAADQLPVPTLLPADLEPGTRIIYLSDMLTEDRPAFVRWAYGVEDDGGQAGVMVVYSPAEFALTGPGVIAEPIVYSDRADLTPADVEAAYREQWQVWGEAVQGTQGGLVVVAATGTKLQMLDAVRSSRLPTILRGSGI